MRLWSLFFYYSKRDQTNLKNKSSFRYNDESIDIVQDFKYLGVTFKYNYVFNTCKYVIKDQSMRGVLHG